MIALLPHQQATFDAYAAETSGDGRYGAGQSVPLVKVKHAACGSVVCWVVDEYVSDAMTPNQLAQLLADSGPHAVDAAIGDLRRWEGGAVAEVEVHNPHAKYIERGIYGRPTPEAEAAPWPDRTGDDEGSIETLERLVLLERPDLGPVPPHLPAYCARCRCAVEVITGELQASLGKARAAPSARRFGDGIVLRVHGSR